MFLEYRIVFAEDWSIGSGEAGGRHLDRRIRRDGDGLPFVPGSSVLGVVREAARVLCRAQGLPTCDGAVDRGEGGLGTLCGVNGSSAVRGFCPICTVFGSSHHETGVLWGPAKLDLGPPEHQEKLAAEARNAGSLLARRHGRTAIDPLWGRAREKHLYAAEEARAGLELSGTVSWDMPLTRRQIALLVAALRLVREIGGGRRRGLGACRLWIDRARLAPAFTTWEEAVRAWAAGNWSEPELPVVASQASFLQPVASAVASQGNGSTDRGELGSFLELSAVTVGSVVLGSRPDQGNVMTGLAHVPGSTVRGALAARWQGDKSSPEFHRVFLSGRVRFGFLYPAMGNRTGVPARRSLQTCKSQPGARASGGHGIFDLLTDRFPQHRVECPECRQRLVSWGPCFEADRSYELPRLEISPHNRIALESPKSGRVGSNSDGSNAEGGPSADGALFAYQSLPEGKELRGGIAARDPEDLAILLRGLGVDVCEGLPAHPFEFSLRVGRRKRALGSLRCRLGPSRLQRSKGVGLFPEIELLSQHPGEPLHVRIDLLTPAIVRDDLLRYREALHPKDLELKRESFAGACSGTFLLAGWNNAHRLPKSDQLAIDAGSSYLLFGVTSPELEILRLAARDGIGERRTEGFGALTVRRIAGETENPLVEKLP